MSEQTKHDGGPAFPVRGFAVDANGALCGETVQSAGMSLRAYFAAKAMQGLMANANLVDFAEQASNWDKTFAGQSVQAADALIAQLNAIQPQPEEQADEPPATMVDKLRNRGWSIAIHNDYRLNGKRYTFYLLTHPNGRWVKAEGRTDRACIEALLRLTDATTPAQPAEQPASVPQYVVEALACAEDALAKAYAVGRDLDSGLTRNTKALKTAREALAKIAAQPTPSPASEQELPQFPCVIELGRFRWKFKENGRVVDVYDRHDDVWAVPGHSFIGEQFARLALRCGGRVVEGGVK